MLRRLFEVGLYLIPLAVMGLFSIPHRYLELPFSRLLWHHSVTGPDNSTRDLPLADFPEFRTRHFLFQTNLFYFDRTGDTRYRLLMDNLTLAQVSSRNYLTFPKVGKQITLFNDGGERQWILESLGYPILAPTGNRFFLASSDSQMVSLYDFNRTPLVTNFYVGSLLTDWQYAPQNDDLVLGTLDGDVITFDYRGHVLFREHPEGSRSSYVKTVALSSRGARVAALSGLYPERLSVWDREGHLRWSVDTGFNRRERQSLVLDEENNILLEQVPSGFRVRRLDNGYTRHVVATSATPGERLDYLRGASVPGGLLVAAVSVAQRTLFLLNREGHLIWKSPLSDRHVQQVEILPDLKHLLVVGSETVYAYRLYQYQ